MTTYAFDNDEFLNGFDNTKTYATRENLVKALEKLNLVKNDLDRAIMIIRTPAGRWTALFLKSFMPNDINLFTPAHLGFKVVG
jgi:hypothetical protein